MKRRYWAVAALLSCMAVGVWASQDDAASEPVHEADLVERTLEIQRQFLLEDHEPLRAELGKLQRSIRLLMPEEEERYGSQAIAHSEGIQRGLSATRELVIAGDFKEARTQFIWVLESCTGCHQATREAGAGPAKPVR